METIQHNGVTFVKATALAKKHRYTTDYIGQLCRGGKVDAKLVGRAWFVNEDSLVNHKSDRYSSARVSEITINKSLVSDREAVTVSLRREVRPVLTKVAHRSFAQAMSPMTYNFQTRGLDRVSTYHGDSDSLELLPTLAKPPAKPIVKPAEIVENVHKINVSLGEKASRKLAFEELPEVSLRGDLAIDSLDDPELFAEVEPVREEQIRFTPESVTKPAVVVTRRYQTPLTLPVSAVPTKPAKLAVPVAAEVFVPIAQSRRVVAVVIESEPLQQKKPIRFIVVPVSVSVALVICSVMLGLVSYAETDGLQLRQSLKFSMASVIESVTKVVESY